MQCMGTTAAQRDRHTKTRSLDGERAADARACTGDQHLLSLKLHGS